MFVCDISMSSPPTAKDIVKSTYTLSGILKKQSLQKCSDRNMMGFASTFLIRLSCFFVVLKAMKYHLEGVEIWP